MTLIQPGAGSPQLFANVAVKVFQPFGTFPSRTRPTAPTYKNTGQNLKDNKPVDLPD